MSIDWLSDLEKNLLGRQCEVVRREADWALNFVGGGSIALSVPWRIVADGRIAFADKDDGQQFGLPAPVDGEACANRLVSGLPITKVLVASVTADLTLHFGRELRLDAFNNSSGYEGWDIALSPANGGMRIIALGGGDVAVYR